RREKTNIQIFYEDYLNPSISFSNNHNHSIHPNLFCDDYPSSMLFAGDGFGMNPFNNNNDGLFNWQEIEQGANYNFEYSGKNLMYKIVLVDPKPSTNLNVSISVIYGFLSDFTDTDDGMPDG
ncbi:MAG: hypothetical protein QMC80_06780, partial [Thermoplasmatales archaeon]|nr:hypothetical protein [Thermoplasmatales archaeon]